MCAKTSYVVITSVSDPDLEILEKLKVSREWSTVMVLKFLLPSNQAGLSRPDFASSQSERGAMAIGLSGNF